MLGHVRVGAGEQQAPARDVRERGPHLLAVDDPLVAVAHGAGREAGEVAARAGLAEELAPDLFGGPQRLQPAGLLLVGAERDDRRRGHAEADDVAPRVEVVGAALGELLVGRRLQRAGQAEAAVPGRVVRGGQPGVEPGTVELRSPESPPGRARRRTRAPGRGDRYRWSTPCPFPTRRVRLTCTGSGRTRSRPPRSRRTRSRARCPRAGRPAAPGSSGRAGLEVLERHAQPGGGGRGHVGDDEAGRDGVRGDAELAELNRERLREPCMPAFAAE